MTVIKQYKGSGTVSDPANWDTVLVGATGPAGPASSVPGPTGPAGATGPAGPPPPVVSLTRAAWLALSPPNPATVYIITDEGGVMLSGTSTPASGLGFNGDFYLNSSTWQIYGPKTTGGWGTGTSIIGPPGSGGGGSGVTIQEDGTPLSGTFTTLNFANGLDLSGAAPTGVVTVDLSEYSGANLPNAKVQGLGALATLGTVGTTQISNDAVTYAKLQNISANNRVLGLVTGAPADAIELTGTQVTAMLDDFTTTSRGAVPNPTAASGRFLKDDGTWSMTPSGVSGAGNVFPFTYNTSTLESITGSQLRGNNGTFSSSTKLWISEITVDGLDVTVGLGRIKAGFQVYVQDYSSASRYALFSVTADSVDKGTYWELTVTPVSFLGVIPGGKVALQSLSSAQSSTLFSVTTTAPGLTPGANNAGATSYLSGAGTWTVPTGSVPYTAPTTSVAAIVGLLEGTTNGTNRVNITGPANIAADYTVTLPPAAGTLATIAGTETLTNKTLTTPVIATITNTGAITLPTGPETLVGRATTDTLTNKTLTAPTLSGTVAGTYTIGGTPTFPAAVVQLTTTQTLTNKTLTSPVINTPTGIVKADVGLGNVDNTSDATKNSAVATLTNKTLAFGSNTVSGTLAQFNTAISDADVPAALNGLVAVWKGTQAQYDAIGTKDSNTLYVVT